MTKHGYFKRQLDGYFSAACWVSVCPAPLINRIKDILAANNVADDADCKM